MIKYVVGFAFSRCKKDVLLIKKLKPEWQKNRFNGIGGKIEEGESPESAIEREFFEETGIRIPQVEWRLFAKMEFDGSEMYCFTIYTNRIYQARTTETEEIFQFSTKEAIHHARLITNLRTLIPMAIDEDFIFANIKSVIR